MKSTLIAVSLALATLVLLEPTANALVHRLSLSHLRLPAETTGTNAARSRHASEHPLTRLAKHHGLDRASFQQRIQQETTAPAASSGNCPTTSNGSGASNGGAQASLSTESGNMMVAEANIGTEGQGPFVLSVNFWNDQLYVLGAKAKYSDGGRIRNKQMYNSSASSTYMSADTDFTADYTYISGSVGEDVVTIGALNANLSLQVTKKVSGWLRDVDIDGTLGLGVSDDLDGSSLVEQLAPQLNSPVITYHINEPWYEWRNYEDAPEGSGVLSFGDLAADTCDIATWAPLTSGYTDIFTKTPLFDITAISQQASSDACDAVVLANITVYQTSLFMPYYVSYQVQQVLVKASGAKWNQDAWAYVVDDASKAQPVSIQLANGGTIKLTAEDYLITATDGTQILYVVGWYNQDQSVSDLVYFPQQFRNNHCFSMNANTGEWSIASALKQTETVRTSSSASSEYDSA